MALTEAAEEPVEAALADVAADVALALCALVALPPFWPPLAASNNA